MKLRPAHAHICGPNCKGDYVPPEIDFQYDKSFTTDWPFLIKHHGSMRRIIAAYWREELSREAERVVEECVQKPVLIGMKPL